MTAKLPNPLSLYHGTTEAAGRKVLAHGFAVLDVSERLQGISERYEVDYDRLADEVMSNVWDRDRIDPHVHCATNPRTAADFARRGGEIEYFARQAVYFLLNETAEKENPASHVAAQGWAKAEVATTEPPVIIQLRVPHDELPADKLASLERSVDQAGGVTGNREYGKYFALLPNIASKYVEAMEYVAPCTCWRDGRFCPVCEDFERAPGGWDGERR